MSSPDHELERVRAIAEAVRQAGGRALVVGGWVRDRLLGLSSKDVDVEVFGVEAAALRALLGRFGRVETIGESFTVYKVGDVDVALPRRESKVGRGHRGFLVEGDPSMSVEDASRRRDFTFGSTMRRSSKPPFALKRRHVLHRPQPSSWTGSRQLRAWARAMAVVVLPTPGMPTNR